MPRPQRAAAELQAASEHLFYEVWMFDQTARALAGGLFGEGPARNAFLESFTVHARALASFVFAENPRPDDVAAEDYFDDPTEWPRIRGNAPAVLSAVHARVGKEIAHLTYARLDVTPEAKGWNILEVMNALGSVVKLFARAVPADRLGPSWAQTKGR